MRTGNRKPAEVSKLHQTPINRSKPNREVSLLLEQYYEALYIQLVRTAGDEDIFQDVTLSMTYKYKGGSFTEHFKKEFRSHKSRIERIKINNKACFQPVDNWGDNCRDEWD